MMKILRRLMTDSSRCSDRLSGVLAILLLMLFALPAWAEREAWSLPLYKEYVKAGSVMIGNAFARDTYLSESGYGGTAMGYETDAWTGYSPDRIFRYGRTHSSLLFSPMTNRLGGGSTLQLTGTFHTSMLWPAVNTGVCDLLLGPAFMLEAGVLYNRQNSNNPANAEGYIGAGLCVDNTLRFRFLNKDMAFLATLHMPFAGVGVAPDYDLTYWHMYRYGEYGKAIHFITPFNNLALMQQVALVVPFGATRIKVGYTFDYTGNRLGGHARSIGSNLFTIGCVMRFQKKDWGR